MVRPAEITIDDLSGADAADIIRSLREVEPVAWIPVLDGWLVTSHALAVEVMRDSETFTVDHPGFSTAQVVGPSMLSLDGAEHLRHRRPFGAAFRASQVENRFGALTTTLAAQLVEEIRPLGQADLRSALAGPLSVGVVTRSLGLGAADATTVLRWYSAIVGAVTDITAGDPPRPEAAIAMADLAVSVRSVLADSSTSLLAAAATALDEAEITSNSAVLMFGGIDTTEGMILNALLHILSDPAWSEAVRADRSFDASVIEESLRLEPAASVVDRYATKDVELGNAQIRRGALVRVSLLGANRDPEVFLDPDVFDPRRTNLDRQVAFARGPHSCLAMDLARLETTAALRAVFDRLPRVRLARRVDVRGLVFRKPAELPLVWDNAG